MVHLLGCRESTKSSGILNGGLSLLPPLCQYGFTGSQFMFQVIIQCCFILFAQIVPSLVSRSVHFLLCPCDTPLAVCTSFVLLLERCLVRCSRRPRIKISYVASSLGAFGALPCLWCCEVLQASQDQNQLCRQQPWFFFLENDTKK